jgi:predicted component of type VI protein secretion system
VQTPTWYQRLSFQVEELAGFCSGLIRQTLTEMQTLLSANEAHGLPATLLMTHSAAALPGLQAALTERFQSPPLPRPLREPDEDNDFGEDLLLAARQNNPIHVLEADAVGRAAHELALRLDRGQLAEEVLEQVPLPFATPATTSSDAGPPRLTFRGQEYLLSDTIFTLGRDPTCDLVFESELYPSVSARHCDILCDRRGYTLRDHSRHGTTINDSPVTEQTLLSSGDWIRLGPSGPLVRFLGPTSEPRRLMTTA